MVNCGLLIHHARQRCKFWLAQLAVAIDVELPKVFARLLLVRLANPRAHEFLLGQLSVAIQIMNFELIVYATPSIWVAIEKLFQRYLFVFVRVVTIKPRMRLDSERARLVA